MPAALEAKVRKFVAAGSGIPSRDVFPGNDPNPRPLVLYATVLALPDTRTGYPILIERDDRTTGTDVLQYRIARYSVQWYRKGADDAALAFDTYAMSPDGLTYAETAEFRVHWPLEIINVDDVVGDAYELRRGLTLPIEYVHQVTRPTIWYDTVSGIVRSPEGSFDVEHAD